MSANEVRKPCATDWCGSVTRRTVLAAAAAAPAAITLGMSTGGSVGAQGSDSDTLTVAVRNPICGLDPSEICGYPSGPAVLYLIANRLVRVDLDLETQPDLAESWEVSDDGLSWTMHLRQGVVFQDGTPFTSDAIRAHFEYSRNPDFAFTTAVAFPQITSIDYPDEYTVVFGLDEPFGAFLTNMAVYIRAILSPAQLDSLNREEIATRPVGTGRYQVAEFTPDVELVLERFDDYFGEPAPLSRIVILPSPEASSRANLLRTGQVDVAEDLPIEELADLDANPDINVIQRKSLFCFGINFNQDIEPFDDVRVRQALNYAVDKHLIADAIFGGAASVLDSPLAEPIVGHVSVGSYEYDPDRALALLEEAGWTDSDGDGILDKDGVSLSPRLIYNESALRGAEVVQAIQGDLRRIGVDLEIELIEQSAWGGTVLTERGNLTAEMQMTSFNPSDGNALRQLTFMFQTNSDPEGIPTAGNWGWYSNPEVDAAFDAANQVIDPADRLEPLATAQQLLWDDAPWLWLYAPDLLVGVRSNVQGVDVFPMSFLDLINASKS